MARRQLEKLPPDRLARLDITNLAAYLGVSADLIEPLITWDTPTSGALTYGAVTVTVQRAVENGRPFVWRRHLDRAIDATEIIR